MKHLTIISSSVFCVLFSMVSIATEKVSMDTLPTAENNTAVQTVAEADTVTETPTEQALKSVPLKPTTTEKVQVGSIKAVDIAETKTAVEDVVTDISEVIPDEPANVADNDDKPKQPEAFTPVTPVAAVDINPEDAAPISLDEVNSDSAIPTDRIRSVISNQEKAWNSGDIDAYMQGYWKSDKLRFVSNGKYNYGWDSILASYKRSYPTSARMGKLNFKVREIKMLSNYAALVVGRWTLERAKDKPSGVFTLLIERIDDKWVITHDHSSD